jgi:hypothetical protein
MQFELPKDFELLCQEVHGSVSFEAGDRERILASYLGAISAPDDPARQSETNQRPAAKRGYALPIHRAAANLGLLNTMVGPSKANMCSEIPNPDVFIVNRGPNTQRQVDVLKRVCGNCLSQSTCQRDNMHDTTNAVYGGLTLKERQAFLIRQA